MREKFSSWFRHFVLLGIPITLILAPTNIHANGDDLLDTYIEIKQDLEENVYGIPVYIESNGENHTMLGEIYGIIAYPFGEVRQALGTPENWCEIAPQHLNIKACTYQHLDGYCELTFYTGRKYYEDPDEVYQIPYHYRKSSNGEDYFQASLTAPKGPMGTKNYRIEVEAISLRDSRTFIRFSYAYEYNFLTELGMETYLATLGRNKIGFSVTGKNERNEPVYIDGIRGIIERNAVRYYLAIQSYLDTRHTPVDERFKARINKWFDLTEIHHHQLYEMNKQDYLEYKQLERKDQIRLQQVVDNNNVTNKKCETK